MGDFRVFSLRTSDICLATGKGEKLINVKERWARLEV